MRRRKEDDPFMASEREHAQSELMCIAYKKECVIFPITLYSLHYCFRKINHLVHYHVHSSSDVREAVSGTVGSYSLSKNA
jgi:hypothetical protein